MIEDFPFFTKMVDELVEFGQYDPELESGIKWIDSEAFTKAFPHLKDASFYDKVFDLLSKHDANQKAKSWLEHKDD